jgi:hypothetical protein
MSDRISDCCRPLFHSGGTVVRKTSAIESRIGHRTNLFACVELRIPDNGSLKQFPAMAPPRGGRC